MTNHDMERITASRQSLHMEHVASGQDCSQPLTPTDATTLQGAKRTRMIKQCHAGTASVIGARKYIFITQLPQPRSPSEIPHHRVALHLYQRHQVNWLFRAYGHYLPRYHIEFAPIPLAGPVALALRQELFIAGGRAVDGVKEVLTIQFGNAQTSSALPPHTLRQRILPR
ncbi:MAG: hypothetical protein IK023_04190 [Bacteroidaceae bacterium]|nr:hypothetical protein [Bacteroidaceae bacterium]